MEFLVRLLRKVLPEGRMAKVGGLLGVLAGASSLAVHYADQWLGLGVPGFTPMSPETALLTLTAGLGVLGIRLRQDKGK